MNPHSCGPWRITRLIGQGGMGIVYHAIHQDSGIEAAVKLLNSFGTESRDYFRREMHAISRIRHPGIISILDSGLERGRPWYAMPYLRGESLRKHVMLSSPQSEDGTIPVASVEEGRTRNVWFEPSMTTDRSFSSSDCQRVPHSAPVSLSDLAPLNDSQHRHPFHTPTTDVSRVLSLLALLCDPLAYMHGEGIVHRDLKPDNVIVDENGYPIIVDFGLMYQFWNQVSREELRVDLNSAGTVSYMAPEQIRGELVDARADLYAMGCILYELLVGHPPFLGILPEQIASAHLREDPVPPSELRPDLTAEVDNLVLWLLAKNPADRLGYCDTLKAILHACGAEYRHWPHVPQARPYLYRSGFIGRRRQWNVLWTLLDKHEQQHGALAAVTGVSGAGKTRFVVELGRQAVKFGFHVLTGEAQEGALTSFYALQKPLTMLGDQCRLKGSQETQRLFDASVKLLRTYEPSLRDIPGAEAYPEPEPLPPMEARDRLLSAMLHPFLAVATDQPLLLILDDLQWADELTLAFLEFVAQGGYTEKRPLFIIATWRIEEETEALSKFSSRDNVHLLAIDSLDDDAVRDITADMLALRPAPAVFGAHIARHAEGNPFFVAEYLRFLMNDKLLWRDDAGSWQISAASDRQLDTDDLDKLPLPGSIRQLIERRCSFIDEDSRLTLLAAAVLGKECDLSILVKMCDQDEDKTLLSLNNLIRQQILETVGPTRFRFIHDKIRETFYDSASEEKRTVLHLAAAHILKGEQDESADQTWDMIAVARHFERAGAVQDATAMYYTAGSTAKKRFAFDQAVFALEKTLLLNGGTANEDGIIVGASPRLDAEANASVYFYLGAISRHIRHSDLAEAWLRFGLKAGYLADEHPLTMDLRNELGNTLRDKGQHDEALTLFLRNLELAEMTNSHDHLGSTLSNISLVHLDRGFHDQAIEYINRAIAIARENADQLGLTIYFGNLALVLSSQGLFQEALEWHQRELDIALKHQMKERRARALGNMGIIYWRTGNIEKARECFENYCSVSKEIGLRRDYAIACGNLGAVYYSTQNFERAIECFTDYLVYSQETGFSRGIGAASSNLGVIAMDLGDYDQADHYFSVKLSVSEKLQDPKGKITALGNLGSSAFNRGDLDRAEQYFTEAIAMSRTFRIPTHLPSDLFNLAKLMVQKKQFSEAEKLLEETTSIARQLSEHMFLHQATLLQLELEARHSRQTAVEKILLLKQSCDQSDFKSLAEMEHLLFRLTKHEQHRQAALTHYRNLYAINPLALIKKSISELE